MAPITAAQPNFTDEKADCKDHVSYLWEGKLQQKQSYPLGTSARGFPALSPPLTPMLAGAQQKACPNDPPWNYKWPLESRFWKTRWNGYLWKSERNRIAE